MLGDRYTYDAFNANIYDLLFGFSIREMPISGFIPRIRHFKNHPELLNDEHWLPLNEQYDVLVRPYSTVSERLAMRLIPVPVETVEYYADPRPLLGLDPTKKTIVCYEYPDKAQDNGMIFFKYLVDQHRKHFNIYYIISRSSPDLKNLAGYENHIVFYKSPENIEVVQAADVLCHTHSSSYALPFSTYRTEQFIQEKHKIFLQHGVTGSKDVSSIYGKKLPHPFTNLFVVSSEREKNLIERDYGFDADEIVVTGMARFDQLITERSRWLKRYKNRKKILIMPTWRPKLDTYPDEQFMESDYYQEFQALITDERLKNLVMDNKYEVSFYLHRNFQKFSHLFHSDFVDVVGQDVFTVKELLENHHVLITDYSSVGLDFSLMHKKVLYYRPPVLIGEDNAGESTDLLPGDIIESREALMESLRELKMPKRFKRNLSHIYAFDDTKASKRIFEAMQHHFHL
ncbi:CDP-glycerol glycerophosphotransferase family protein [Exiguobacterium sp. RIT341]|uniref:CDP-glycerol glycerophosphotransferase family protein n=1 Tax=Exiguobacterium sp. RIT341 TaxID=1470592 RepID=UPI00044963DE|nr:CDP-glycerol glycerophosphotransferase family protein [Exiguobacterium sp. RIT341]EZP61479.1 CDP-glycerol glycerophosphotransferase [Exiguobacterium sp. RIT341]